MSSVAQSYTRETADEMIRRFQVLGVTVESFFSEIEFISTITKNDARSDGKQTVVLTDAESGSERAGGR